MRLAFGWRALRSELERAFRAAGDLRISPVRGRKKPSRPAASCRSSGRAASALVEPERRSHRPCGRPSWISSSALNHAAALCPRALTRGIVTAAHARAASPRMFAATSSGVRSPNAGRLGTRDALRPCRRCCRTWRARVAAVGVDQRDDWSAPRPETRAAATAHAHVTMRSTRLHQTGSVANRAMLGHGG